MAKKYLDTDGLTRVFSKMKALVSDAENAKRAKAAVITTAGSGSAYTATVPGVTELYTGLTITIIPHTVSTTTAPTLNVNSLGAKNIRQQLSTNSGSTTSGGSSSWLTASKPITVRYDGTQWVVVGLTRPAGTNIYGTVPVSSGGTGNTSVDTTPTSGSTKMVTSGGIYDAIANAIAALGSPAKVATGSYVGTDQYMASHPNTLSFDFQPKLVIVMQKAFSSSSQGVERLILVNPATSAFIASGSTKYVQTVTWNNNGVSWYCATNASVQLNSSSFTYVYVAIG